MSASAEQREREIITELLDLYRDLPCLWDICSESYKDARQRKNGWEILLTKYKELDENATEASVRKKIDALKSGYHREAKKVKVSKNRTGSAASDIHKPSLWYYELMTFLEKKTEANRSGVDTLISEDEDQPMSEGARKLRPSRESILEKKKLKLIDSAQNLLKEKHKDLNSFGLYVGEKIEQIHGDQREIAEKLISEVIFLAKMSNLSLESKIYTPPISRHYVYSPQHVQSPPSFHNYNPSPSSSHQRHSSTVYSPQHIHSPPSSHDHNPSPSSSHQRHSSTVYSPQHIHSPPSSHDHNPSPSSSHQRHSSADYSSQHIQSPPSSHTPHNHNSSPSSAHRPESSTVYSSQRIQSPPSSHTPHNHNPSPSSARQPYLPAIHSPQLVVQSPPLPVEPHNPSTSSTHSPHSQALYTTNQSQAPISHNTHSPTVHSLPINIFSSPIFQDVQAFENARVVEGPARDVLKELLIFKK